MNRVLGVAPFIIPAIAGAIAGALFLGPGVERPALGVRVLGYVVDGSEVVGLRLEGVRSYLHVDEASAIDGVNVAIVSAGADARWKGDIGANGIGEVALARTDGAPLIQGHATLLLQRGTAHTEVDLALSPPVPGPSRVLLAGTSRGDVRLEVSPVRGAFAAPFIDAIEVRAPGSDAAHIELAAEGADIAPQSAEIGPGQRAAFNVRPLAHDVTLAIDAKSGSATGHWEGTLPIIPGGQWIAANALEKLTVTSPVPHDSAFVSFWSPKGRVGGAVVALHREPDGFFRGDIDTPTRATFVTLAGDGREGGTGTIAWPLRPARGACIAPELRVLLDDVPAAIARERSRSGEARSMAAYVIAAAGLLEVSLLLARARAAKLALEAHLSGVNVDASTERKITSEGRAPWLWTLVLASVLAFAFAMFAALATFGR
jgi:hypothetical protein